jgi:putative ABC transport system permease protein
MKQGLRPAMIGLLVGLGIAALSTSALSSLLYGVERTDPMTFAAVGLLLLVACMCTCAVPAYRAARADVVAALRST